MSLGVPAQVAREAGNRAVAASSQVAALICLASAVASVLAPGFFIAGGVRWWAAGCLLPMAAALVVVMRTRGPIAMAAYVVIGFAATFGYTVALLQQTVSYTNTDLFTVALPVIALMLVGGSAYSARAGVLWATCAYVAGDLAVFIAAITVGRQFQLESISLAAYIAFMLMLLFHGITRSAHRGAHTLILRTMREQRTDEVRRSVAAELRAELHDTTLSELAALASAQPGPLPPGLRERLVSDIRHWTSDEHRTSSARVIADEADWRDSELARAIGQARDSGLVVELTGDRTAYVQLHAEARRALGLAARQCLVNVLKHSGQSKAEVLVSSSRDLVSLVVVDAGRGFDFAAVAAQKTDRMGLLHSVIDRVERAGGSVTVFSRPGAGTSVLMAMPIAKEVLE